MTVDELIEKLSEFEGEQQVLIVDNKNIIYQHFSVEQTFNDVEIVLGAEEEESE